MIKEKLTINLRINPKKEIAPEKLDRSKRLVILMAIIFLGLVLVQIYLSGKLAVRGDYLRDLETKKKELILENANLQEQINQISSLSYIEEKAQEELKMTSGIDRAWYLSTTAYDLARR